MYLKSLTLKGFKSFADRTVMKFEPGVAAIVGPNGSGKSNISDAVLWVLGERNVKNLRGQSMEDVIFAGSSARKPVSMAEVELLLDNSDGSLAIDYSEVAIGRRMYRSGESEYLINGTVVRRMDVLDVLHDSGLGTATNSIISQGNLDRVLSSRPEDRRALIEEAAGILKHKERKAKSERKLAQMDAHLDRVNDITAEVARQLKPLERKARKARTFQELSSELSDLELALAVDDLRALQGKMTQTVERENDLMKSQAQARHEVEEAEKRLDDLQRAFQEKGSEEGRINERRRRIQSCGDRLSSTALLLRERRQGYLAEAQRLAREVEEGRIRNAAANRELEEARETVASADKEHARAKTARGELEIAYQQRVNERNDLRKRVDTLMTEQRALSHRRETLQAAQSALRENLSERRAHAQVIDAQVIDAEKRASRALEACESCQREFDRLDEELSSVREHESAARERLNVLVVEREQGRRRLDEAREALARSSAERAALEELERASESTNPALTFALDESHRLSTEAVLLTHILSAPEELDALIEALLGSDLHALIVPTDEEAARLVGRIDEEGTTGEVVFLGGCAGICGVKTHEGRRLIDELSFDPGYASRIEALIGDVFVVDTLADALIAHRRDASVRYASLDGCVVDPSGRISCVRRSEEDRRNSALARRRSLERVREEEAVAAKRHDDEKRADSQREEDLRGAQTEALRLSESLAGLKGRLDSARAALEDAKRSAAQGEQERVRLVKEQEENRAFLEQAKPDSDSLERDLAEVEASLSKNKDEVVDLQRDLSPLQKKIVSLSEQVSDARLEAARLSERLAYAQRMVLAREQEIASHAREGEASGKRIAVARGAASRADALASTLSSLIDSADFVATSLERASREEQDRFRALHEQLSQATSASRDLRESYDAFGERLADVRIEKGRLEVQIDAGAKTIVEDCGVSLETAFALDPIEDRTDVSARAESLKRRIKNLGAINPDAAEEFEQVSARHAYLVGQLDDMMAARRSLARIIGVIDERMKDDFLTTFNKANDNFAEIFSTLFPGGQAHLSLIDPDDIENTGVDVNAQPIGKRVKKMSLLSGGEKSMTAMALLFAVYRIRQTPFYILDEVEAALDDTNLRRLIAYLNVIRDETQFIMITHQRRTMESADILYGVSMQADGITKVISQKLDNATRKEG